MKERRGRGKENLGERVKSEDKGQEERVKWVKTGKKEDSDREARERERERGEMHIDSKAFAFKESVYSN